MDDQSPPKSESFIPVAGLKLVFQPGKSLCDPPKKHACTDCHFCQLCSDGRCQACRNSKVVLARPSKGKLSLCEQICLYERINSRQPS
jgi:hypothetical protein